MAGRPWAQPPRHGYEVVLALIVATYGLGLAGSGRWVLTALVVLQTITVWQALRVSRTHLGVRVAAAAVVVLAAASVAASLISDARTLLGATFLAATLLYVIAPFAVLRDLGRRGVDRQTLLGALAAYLLIGMAFAFAYECVAALQPGPLFGDKGDPTLPAALFFSFVTMTTTGYGDRVPAGNPAQTIAVIEALVGQLFLVTAVAKVVENWRPQAWRRTSFARDDASAADGGEHTG
jgi:Ion channel